MHLTMQKILSVLICLISTSHAHQALSEGRVHEHDSLELLAGLLLSRRPSATFSASATLSPSPAKGPGHIAHPPSIRMSDAIAEVDVSSTTVEDLQSQTVKQLQAQLKTLGLKVSGSKAELIARLGEHAAQREVADKPVKLSEVEGEPPLPLKYTGFGHIDPQMLPATPTEMLQRLNARLVSFLGDSVYTLALRERCLWPPGHFKDLTQREENICSAVGQSNILNEVFKTFKLHHAEKEWIKRGENTKVKGPKSASVESYRRATGLESLVGALYISNPNRCRELLDLVMKGSSEEEMPTVTSEMVSSLSAQHLAWVGDAVFSNTVRQKFIWPPTKINDLHLRVQALTSAKGQNMLYQRLWPGFQMSDAEKDILRDAQKSKHTGPAKVDPIVYRNAQSFEALIGYLHLTDSKRLQQLMKFCFRWEKSIASELRAQKLSRR
mmetsp:Transcript_124500/g.215757  ORF Transcript_124500/g.215757 Transcript_124500/m.215757 type:complete len:439 (-) Transcript_124500:113-1429(-)